MSGKPKHFADGSIQETLRVAREHDEARFRWAAAGYFTHAAHETLLRDLQLIYTFVRFLRWAHSKRKA